MHELFEMTRGDIVRVLIAALGGAAVGLNVNGLDTRTVRRRASPAFARSPCSAGIGGVSGVFWIAGVTAPAAILLSGAVAIVAAAVRGGQSPGYRRHHRSSGAGRARGRTPRRSRICHPRERPHRDSRPAAGGKIATAFAGATDRRRRVALRRSIRRHGARRAAVTS